MLNFLVNDGNARFGSGILNGNINQFGDFDQCINVRHPSNEFRGKYCLAYFQPTVTKSLKYMDYLRRLIQSHDAFKSNLNDVSINDLNYLAIIFCIQHLVINEQFKV